jgi:hypothetical protein
MSDEGVSELLGYSILAGMVITAVIFVASGAGEVITSAVENAGFSEATLAMRSFAAAAANSAHANNTYFTASEVRVPSDYELITLDGDDDIAHFAVSIGNLEVFSTRMGSVSLRSSFRSATFEGGSVFGNDSGAIDVVRKPSIFTTMGGEGKSLYISLIEVSSGTASAPGGRNAILDVKAVAARNVSQPSKDTVTLAISSSCPEGWSAVLRNEGFTVEQKGNKVTARMGGIEDVCIDCTTLQVRIE